MCLQFLPVHCSSLIFRKNLTYMSLNDWLEVLDFQASLQINSLRICDSWTFHKTAVWCFYVWPQIYNNLGFLCGSADKKSACKVGDLDSIPGLGRSPGRGGRLPTPVFWPREIHGLPINNLSELLSMLTIWVKTKPDAHINVWEHKCNGRNQWFPSYLKKPSRLYERDHWQYGRK